MASDNLRAILLQTARHDFPVFYLKASEREAKLMDMLVVLTALFLRLNEPAPSKPTDDSRDEECAATRRMFVDLREFIRNGRTFASLPHVERQKIERVIFDRVD